MKTWKSLIIESCPNCGDDLEVLSAYPESLDTEEMQIIGDGEDVRCAAGCGFKSAVSVDEDSAWVQDGNLDQL